MTTNSDRTSNDGSTGGDTIGDRVRGEVDEGGILGRRDDDLHPAGSSFEDDPTDAGLDAPDSDEPGRVGDSPDTGPDDGMGPDAPDDVAGEDEPVPGIDDDIEDDR